MQLYICNYLQQLSPDCRTILPFLELSLNSIKKFSTAAGRRD